MLADSYPNDFSLSQQAKSGKHISVYFCAASSGTNIKLSTVMRNSAWGLYVSMLPGNSKISAYLSLPFHSQVHSESSLKNQYLAHSGTWSFPSF